MKKINIFKYKAIACLLFGIVLLINNACTIDKGDGWADARYLENFEFYIYHTNPITGEDYTEEELADLTYDPKAKEQYAEGQPVEVTIVSAKMPTEVKVHSGADLSVLATITNFTEVDGKYRSDMFSSSLEDLGLLEIGDKGAIKVYITFVDGTIGSVEFGIKRVKFFDPNAIVDTFVFLKKSTGETIPLRIDEKVTSRVKDGAYGSIVELDGVDDQVEILDIPELGFRYDSDYSIGFWVNTMSTDSDPVMIGDQDWGSSSNPGLTIAHRGDNWRVATADGSTKADTNYDGAYNDGNWHYLAVTFDRDGNMTLYQDGVSVATESMAGVGNTKSNNPLRIGQDGTGGYGQFFQGKVGEVSIFDYALTPEQVANASTPKTGVQLKKQDGSVKNVPVANAGGVISGEEDRFTYEFDGTSQYATINDSDLGFRYDSDYSISFWVNTTSGDSDPVMLGDQDWNSSGNTGLTIAFRGSNWRVAYSDGTTKADTNHDSNFNDGGWHLATVTFDRDGNMKLYADGVMVASEDMSAVGTANSGNPLRLAQDGPATYGQFFQGKIAEVVIYDYVLTDGEVSALFN